MLLKGGNVAERTKKEKKHPIYGAFIEGPAH